MGIFFCLPNIFFYKRIVVEPITGFRLDTYIPFSSPLFNQFSDFLHSAVH